MVMQVFLFQHETILKWQGGVKEIVVGLTRDQATTLYTSFHQQLVAVQPTG